MKMIFKSVLTGTVQHCTQSEVCSRCGLISDEGARTRVGDATGPTGPSHNTVWAVRGRREAQEHRSWKELAG